MKHSPPESHALTARVCWPYRFSTQSASDCFTKSCQRSVSSCLRVFDLIRLKRGVMPMPISVVDHFCVADLPDQSFRATSRERLRMLVSPVSTAFGPLEGGFQPAMRRPWRAAS